MQPLDELRLNLWRTAKEKKKITFRKWLFDTEYSTIKESKSAASSTQ